MGAKKTIPDHATKVFQGKIFSVWQWPQTLFDGSTRTYEGIARRDTVYTVGIMPDKKILLAWDKQPHRPPVITPPGGQIDDGESPREAAKREFFEETGYRVGKLIKWHYYQPYSRARYTVHAFIGRDLEVVNAPQNSPGERISLKTFTFSDFLQLGRSRHLRDWQLKVILLEALLDKNKLSELREIFYG